MTQRKEHSWSEWDYENRCTPVWVLMLTSASCCRHVQQDSACSVSESQDSDINTQGTAPVYVIDIKISSSLDDVMSSTREDVLLRCADSSLNHEWSKTASFVSCFDACLDTVGVRPPLDRADAVIGLVSIWHSVKLCFVKLSRPALNGYTMLIKGCTTFVNVPRDYDNSLFQQPSAQFTQSVVVPPTSLDRAPFRSPGLWSEQYAIQTVYCDNIC
jgi:hypothetical protein